MEYIIVHHNLLPQQLVYTLDNSLTVPCIGRQYGTPFTAFTSTGLSISHQQGKADYGMGLLSSYRGSPVQTQHPLPLYIVLSSTLLLLQYSKGSEALLGLVTIIIYVHLPRKKAPSDDCFSLKKILSLQLSSFHEKLNFCDNRKTIIAIIEGGSPWSCRGAHFCHGSSSL
jgi:hypothetical protein